MTIAAKASSVEFQNVTKAYGASVAVRNVSFVVEAGTLATLLGPSGCGKTTTLRMIAGLELPTSGRILIGGADVTDAPATARDVTMVFQSYALFPHMSVLDNVAYGLTVSGVPKAQAHEKAREGLALVGLAGYERRQPSELSGGQQQRVAVARALVLEPEVLLFDEPLSNLDAKLRRRMREDIRDLQLRMGLTSVYVTHDQDEALAVSDKIIVMNEAVVAQEGTPEELYEDPANLFAATFVGEANVLDGEIVAVADGRATIRVAGIAVTARDRGLPLGPVKLAVRPHALSLSATRPDGAAPGLPGQIVKAAYLGRHVEYGVSTEAGELFVVAPPDGVLGAGASVWVSFAEKGLAAVAG